jgi:starch synthase
MAKPLSVLFVTSEVFPFAKVGGIADVSYSLPLALRDIGHDVRVMLPKYGQISERKNRIHEINRLRDIPVAIGDKTDPATVKSSSINNPRTKVQAYITTNQRYFNSKKGIYGDTRIGRDYSDNDDRFIYFDRTVVDTCMILNWYPDIIHCNDWQTAIIAGYVKAMFPAKFKKTKIVFTIHNFYKQGIYPLANLSKTNLPKEAYPNFTHKGKFNFMKGGLIYSDYITTVSPTYGEEILHDKKLSGELNTVLVAQKNKFQGIMNGIDVWGWNPKTDPLIKRKFLGDFNEFKTDNKIAMLKEFDLPYKEGTPVIGLISRLDAQKGTALLLESIDKLMEENIQMVVLGEGDQELKNSLRNAAKKYPDKLSVKIIFDEILSHQIEAGADMFLMPSLYEPCGLNAMYSILYGTIPIARATGGLIDTVKEYNSKAKTGNGFLFKEFKPESLVTAVKKAIGVYKKKEEWQAFGLRCMSSNFSWENSAKKYDEVYRAVFKD